MINNDVLEKVSDLIFKLIENQKKLIELELFKKEVLIKGDVDKLDEILILEQPLLMNNQSLDSQCDKLLKEEGLDSDTLKQFISNFDCDNKYLLKSKFDELCILLEKLKKVNLVNMAILNTRMKTLNKVFSLIDIAHSSSVYQKDGQIKINDNKNMRDLV